MFASTLKTVKMFIFILPGLQALCCGGETSSRGGNQFHKEHIIITAHAASKSGAEAACVDFCHFTSFTTRPQKVCLSLLEKHNNVGLGLELTIRRIYFWRVETTKPIRVYV